MVTEDGEPIVAAFPLRGEWVAAHTPAERVPSHGTDLLGQRFAYDFLRIEHDAKGWKFFRGSAAEYALLGVGLNQCYGWSEPIYAPFDGSVITAEDGWPERKRLHFLKDMAAILKNTLLFDPKKTTDLRAVLGNHIILKMNDEEVYAFFAHARYGSLKAGEGEAVALGQHLADVGHSGNSTAPHLHFHLMDKLDILQANGLPCQFRNYEAFHNGEWHKIASGMPSKRELVRYTLSQDPVSNTRAQASGIGMPTSPRA